jgi:hypothetical protein
VERLEVQILHHGSAKGHIDELCEDWNLFDVGSHYIYRNTVFNGSLDIIISHLSQRITSMRDPNKLFQDILPGILIHAHDSVHLKAVD